MSERDLALFPENESGERLWQLLQQGIDINQAIEVEFSMIFPSEEKALAFGTLLLSNNQKLSFSLFEQHETHTWEITAYPAMPLTYQNLMGYKALLLSHANEFDGLFDGWFSAYCE